MVIPELALSPESIGFWGTIVFTCIESWGIWKQNSAVWSKKSGKALSVLTVNYVGILFGVTLAYGCSKPDLALICNGALLTLYIPIIFGLWKFKGFTTTEKWLSVLLVLLLAIDLYLPFKDWGYLIFSCGSMVALSLLPYEMWKVKSSGVVEIRLILVYFASTIFWIVYGFSVHDWVLEIVCPIHLIILGTTVVVWFRYRVRGGGHHANLV